ncbi:DUF7373 family lipoprotein [Tsukamurella paurometabola]|uniref:Lipoprotein n=1 Tax=Tsukamurella paurometabola TaxID=2061 RepID=A0A3P8K202_TSUPA|nr:hypothetical protein [Tsukamurella paurometabola]UEA82034.1 hypothetical protein LK411_16850 [Tsukamurella paurometabola]VDR39064.1 Uncharacterised protein [Tsukamurella paurometabola]
MLRKSLCAVGGALLLVGCSTTVPGSPEADPSGVPRPDTGSYATAPRQVAPMTEKSQVAAEGFRMMEIIPLATEVDGALRYGRSPKVGQMLDVSKSLYGEGVGTALAGHEVAATTSAWDKVPGSDASTSGTNLLMGLFRFKDEAAARSAVAAPSVLAEDKDSSGSTPTPKAPVAVPGYPGAKAYTKSYADTKATVALLVSGRFVLSAYTTGPVDHIKKFFDLQLPALKAFTPTPVDKFSTLTRDHDGLLQYTLAEERPTIYQATFTARAILNAQTDIAGAAKDFADAGVDYVANAGNTVSRARDAAGAALLAERSIAGTKALRAGTEAAVRGVPGGRCLTYPTYKGSKDSRTYCVAPVGRYLAEVTDSQEGRAKQAIGASYLILQQAK